MTLASRSDSGGDSGSVTPEPPSGRPQAPGDESGRDGGNSCGVDAPRVFEVEFPPTGPLGITFEWAADPAALWSGDGGTSEASPRTPPLGPSTLPPISPSPSLAPTSRTTHQLEPPVGQSLVPHALRIQSFPVVPPLEITPRSATAGAETTYTEGGAGQTSANGELKHTVVIQRSKESLSYPRTQHLWERASCDVPTTYKTRRVGGCSFTDFKSTDAEQPSLSKSKSAGRAKRPHSATAEPLDDAERYGPVAGRDVLRAGDVLVAVNGNPVAGPAARNAGITCFEDVVGVVAAATTTSAEAQSTEKTQRKRPRVLSFRREGRQQRPSSPAVVAPTSPPRNVPSRGGWVKGMSGSQSASIPSSSGAAAEQDATNLVSGSDIGDGATTGAGAALVPPKPGWSTLYPVLKLKGWSQAHDQAVRGRTARDKGQGASKENAGSGFFAPLSSRLSGSDASSVDMDSFSAQFSSRSRGSEASFVSNTTSKPGGALRKGKRGRERKGKAGGGSVFSASSAAARIKAEAK